MARWYGDANARLRALLEREGVATYPLRWGATTLGWGGADLVAAAAGSPRDARFGDPLPSALRGR